MSSTALPAPTNLAVVVGVLSRPAEVRHLAPSDTELTTLDVTVRQPGAPTETVPLAWFDAPAWAAELDVDDAVVVIGRVRRRFFRSGRGTESRTEVVADTVVRARQAKRVASVIRSAADRVHGVA